MTKSQPKRKRDTPEAKRWLIVGAYQAGASEKHVARISGLSKTAVRNIILNYQRTGTPSIPRKIPNKVRQKLVVEYDENGEIINTDSEEEDEEKDEEEERKQSIEPVAPVIQKKKVKSSQQNINSSISTKEIINYALNQLRIPDESTLNKPISPVSPVPNNISSITGSKIKLPPPSKFDQNIRGYEEWTHEDDMVLLNHVFHHLHGGGWSDLEVRFNGRHSARLCYDRWKHLKALLLRGITDKPNTPW